MQINLYINYSEKNKMIKSLSSGFPVVGSLREHCSMIDPVITIEHSNPALYNYLQIPDFNGRYYFINNIEHINNRLWRIYARVDVLTSNISVLKRTKAILNKSPLYDSNFYFDDQSWIIENRSLKRIFNFPNSINQDTQNILIVAGKTVLS